MPSEVKFAQFECKLITGVCKTPELSVALAGDVPLTVEI